METDVVTKKTNEKTKDIQVLLESVSHIIVELSAKTDYLSTVVIYDQDEGKEFIKKVARKHLSEEELKLIELESKKYFEGVNDVFSGLNVLLIHVSTDVAFNLNLAGILCSYDFGDLRTGLRDTFEDIGSSIFKSICNKADVTTEISNEQAQELMDAINNQCEEMKLKPTQILDGISRSLLGALMAFGTKDLNVDIENIGTVQVSIVDDTNQG